MRKRKWDVRYETQSYHRPAGAFTKLILLIIAAPFAYVIATVFFSKIKITGLLDALSTFLP